MRDLTEFFFNIVIAFVSVGFTYIIIEVLLFPAFLPLTPLKFQDYLGDIRTLAQSSKEQVSPHDYIGIIGDSHAQGAGDWLLAADPNTNGPFHSAHILYKLTGRDVISFGKGGAGSIDGVMTLPIRTFNRINSSWLYRIERPKILIVYFYEGNDLNNNIKAIDTYVRASGSNTKISLGLKNLVNERYTEAAKDFTPIRGNTYALNFIWALLKYNIGLDRQLLNKIQKLRTRETIKSGNTNKAWISGSKAAIPDGLQSPELALSDDQILLAVKTFELALARLHEFFPEARLIVTIIPSPLTAYQLDSDNVSIHTFDGGNDAIHPAALVEQKSNQICELLASATLSVGAEFFDVRGAIRSLARRQLIHGPKDWKHFNKQGYVELGKALAAYLNESIESPKGCAKLKKDIPERPTVSPSLVSTPTPP